MTAQVKEESAELGLQIAIFERLSQDAGMTLLLAGEGRIFDHVPENQTYPFGVYSGSPSVPWNTTTEKGVEAEVQIDFWSDEEGRSQASLLQQRTKFLLDDQEAGLVVPGYNLVRLQQTFSDVVHEGSLFHGVQRFTAILEEV